MKKNIFVFLLLISLCFPVLIFAENISGTIFLPDVSNKGNLFIVLYPANHSTLDIDYYLMVPAVNINFTTVPYEFTNIEPGEYFIQAIWDVAQPFAAIPEPRGKDVKGWSSDDRLKSSSMVPHEGDYYSTSQMLQLPKAISLNNINIDCKIFKGHDRGNKDSGN